MLLPEQGHQTLLLPTSSPTLSPPRSSQLVNGNLTESAHSWILLYYKCFQETVLGAALLSTNPSTKRATGVHGNQLFT